MNKNNVIGKGTWIDKLAFELIERENKIGRNTNILNVESGLGASGIPHIGSLGDAVRAYGVKLGLENLGYKSELITYSDDLDGLRKIPYGFPSSLENELGKMVSTIQDPFDCHDSYGMHMSSLLLNGLDELGIKYNFKRAKDSYKKGFFIDEIHTILLNHKKIGIKINEFLGQAKYNKYLPYFPVCKNCNKIYTTMAYEYIDNEKKVKYNCKDMKIGTKIINGCGYEGESSIVHDLGKLSWKVEFAARWRAFDIRFEAYGKDIMESVKVNDWVSDEILKYKHPHHAKYEMFLDKKGKKISKSVGNIITSQKWLKYGTTKSILLLLYKRIIGSREIGLENIPNLMDEYNWLEDIFFEKVILSNESKKIKYKGLYEYVNLLNTPTEPSPHLNYRLLVELNKIFKSESDAIVNKLIDYKMIKKSNLYIKNIINLTKNYADDFGCKQTNFKFSDKLKKSLKEFADEIIYKDHGELKNIIYTIIKKNNIQPKKFFIALYQVILSVDHGPKIDKLIDDMGTADVAKIIYKYV